MRALSRDLKAANVKLTDYSRTLEERVELRRREVSQKNAELERILRELLFDPGFTTKGVGVGTGLGMSIAYRIVKKHRGDIEIRSSVGQGTDVAVTLPTDLVEPV